MNAAEEQKSTIEINTSRFGPVSCAEDKVFSFVHPIPGFERLRRFVLIDHDKEGIFKWLQSVEDPLVAFLLTSPNFYKPDYSVPLARMQTDALGSKDAGGYITLVMVCVASRTKQVTINLKGPIILNPANMKAMQWIVDREDFDTHYIICQ